MSKKKSTNQGLHQINFKKYLYIIGGVELQTIKEICKVMKKKLGLMIVERK